jgi:small subunit ribosomal protein S19e
MNIFDVPADKLIEEAAKELEKKIEMPEWAFYVKTGPHKEHPPVQDNWWYIRAASILRRLYKFGRPIGIQRLRKFYGGRKNYGTAPEHKVKGSGKIVRTILQQLEQVGYVKKVPGGRIITPAGKSFLDKIASKIWREMNEAKS